MDYENVLCQDYKLFKPTENLEYYGLRMEMIINIMIIVMNRTETKTHVKYFGLNK